MQFATRLSKLAFPILHANGYLRYTTLLLPSPGCSHPMASLLLLFLFDHPMAGLLLLCGVECSLSAAGWISKAHQ